MTHENDPIHPESCSPRQGMIYGAIAGIGLLLAMAAIIWMACEPRIDNPWLTGAAFLGLLLGSVLGYRFPFQAKFTAFLCLLPFAMLLGMSMTWRRGKRPPPPPPADP